MKKLTAVLLCLALIFAVSGCSWRNENGETAPPSATENTRSNPLTERENTARAQGENIKTECETGKSTEIPPHTRALSLCRRSA